jgi:NAD(P)-dependent dehydrogenase (short-subunit alcohol dehydrogenase family)
VADIGDWESAAAMVDQTVARLGRLDALVNNAGYAPLLPIEEHRPEVLEECYRINSLGPAFAITRVWPIFKRQRSGCIINVSTMGTIDPFPGFFGYAAAKAATNLMALSCANEGREFGIRAFAVAPGAVETAMLRSLFPESKLPSSQTMKPERIASVILDCIEGRCDDRNGQVITVNDAAAGRQS